MFLLLFGIAPGGESAQELPENAFSATHQTPRVVFSSLHNRNAPGGVLRVLLRYLLVEGRGYPTGVVVYCIASYIVVAVVFALTRRHQLVTGQAPITLEWKNTVQENIKTEITHITGANSTTRQTKNKTYVIILLSVVAEQAPLTPASSTAEWKNASGKK